MQEFSESIAHTLQSGGIGVIPTDTIYGIVGSALLPNTVERIYSVRERNPMKPFIILISSYDDLRRFGVSLSMSQEAFMKANALWPGKVSIIIPVTDPHFSYLTRGTKSLAFRMPDVPQLRNLLKKTGPLVAPSANKEGFPHARTIDAARAVFGDELDFYVDDGEKNSEASTIIACTNESFTVVREGAVKISLG